MDSVGMTIDQALEVVDKQYRDEVRRLLEIQDAQVVFHRPGANLQDGGPRPWFNEWDPATGYYWQRLRKYLIDRKGWTLRDV